MIERTNWQLATGEILTEEELEYWYEADIDETLSHEEIPNYYNSPDQLSDKGSGIQITYFKRYENNDFVISSRSLQAITSAKSIYYSHFIVKQLLEKNQEIVKQGKLKARSIKMNRMKLIKGIAFKGWKGRE